ncbi:MAG: lipase maturation factor family protein [Myxococcota bacterium]|nr:lipase maturation factor family protein [Myxococcota bacterium]
MIETVDIYGIFVRLLGLLFVFQFATTAPQLMALVGQKGVEPVAYLLAAFRRDHGSLLGFFKLPTLLWLSSSDRAIRALPWLGCLFGLIIATGVLGEYNALAVFACWFIWLSIINANPNVFGIPWDNLLLECGLWAMMLPGLEPLPGLALLDSPHPWVHLGFTVLAFRVMFGMGLAKFRASDERTRDGTYIFHFLEWQPMATSTAWYLRALPSLCHKVLLVGLFVAEVLFPWLAFAGPDGRMIFAISTLGLQVGIAVCGNYGIFNLAMALLTLPLMATASPWGVPQPGLLSGLAALLLLGTLPYLFVLDSWTQGLWAYAPTKLRTHARYLGPIAGFFRLFAPFRVWNSYGIFVPRGNYPKVVPTLQMSMDGQNWLDVVPRFMTNRVSDCPPRFAPYHPRLDHFIYYNHFRTCDFKVPCLTGINPYYVHEVGFVEKLVEHLYRGNALTQSLFADVPHRQPTHIRMAAFAYRMNPLSKVRESGDYWTRELLGVSGTFERIEMDASTGIQACYDPFIFDSLDVGIDGVAVYELHNRVVPLQRDAMVPVDPDGMACESLNYMNPKL